MTRLAGVDEAGRGPLAGPVMAAAVVFDSDFAESEQHGVLAGLTDSKKLTARQRQDFYDTLRTSAGVQIGVGVVDNLEIDRINILQATMVAMALALKALSIPPELALVDGRPVQGLPCSSHATIQGDSQSLSIAAASVIAKVERDAYMAAQSRIYPVYGFDRHKGYGTTMHIQALLEHGPCPLHRLSFRPVRESAAIHADQCRRPKRS
ncbi:MAG: ribonuclease HII [Verrucomicrobia bacterium]|nr:ribonuclease HII [Verrucomicrobiota bacterium]